MIESINAASYQPVEPLPFYESIQVTNNGSLQQQPALSNKVKSFFESVRIDESIWNGLKGANGRQYDMSHIASSSLSVTEVSKLRDWYIKSISAGVCDERINRLTTEADHQSKLYRYLNNTVLELEREQKYLRTRLRDTGVDSTDLKVRLAYVDQELTSPRRSTNRLRTTVDETTKELSNCHDEKLIQLAILRHIFKENLSHIERVAGFERPPKKFINAAILANSTAQVATRRVWWVKRLYVDMKRGMIHVYDIENRLKDVLEHLKGALNSLDQSFEATLRNEKGTTYRMEYIRKEWDEIDLKLQTAIPYVQQTSLYIARLQASIEAPVKHNSFSSLSCPMKQFGLFEKQPRLLPTFSRFESVYPLSRRSRIVGLHKVAGKAYKEMNKLYDCHHGLLKQVHQRLKTRTSDLESAERELCGVLESILHIRRG